VRRLFADTAAALARRAVRVLLQLRAPPSRRREEGGVTIDLTCARCLIEFEVVGWPDEWAARPVICGQCVTPAELMEDPPETYGHVLGTRRLRELHAIVERVPV
jgi:hypothetical protein